jgi:hypothetical protein
MSDIKNPDKPQGFPNSAELYEFDKGRANGTITVFRARACAVCGRQIPRAFQVCSNDCFGKLPKEETA